MTRNILTISVIAFALILFSGCDAFRTLAGRPTSADIAQKIAMIERQEAAHQARLDSIKAVAKEMADSLALVDSIKVASSNILSAGSIPGISAASLQSRYYIIVGTFSSQENAEKIMKKAVDAGYEALKIKYRSGYTAVGLCPSNTLPEIYSSLQKVKQEKFCPADAWVLVNQ